MIDDIDYHIVRDVDTCLLYDVNASRIFRISSEAGDYLERLDSESEFHSIVEYLSKGTSCERPICTVDFCSSAWWHTGRLDKLTLNVTYQCNLRCKYCYASFGKYDSLESSTGTERFTSYIDILCRFGVHEIGEIMFFGGEPMLAPDVIEGICDHIGNLVDAQILDSVPDYTMISNLTVLDDRMVEIIEHNDIHITMSIDGPEEVNDLLRITADGAGTFRRIKSNWLKIKDHIVNAEATYTRVQEDHGISYGNLQDWLSREFNLPRENCIVVPVYDCPGYEVESDLSKDLFQETSFDAEDGDLLEIIRRNATMDVFCTAGYASLCILPNGDMYPCHMYAIDSYYLLGNIMELKDMDDYILKLQLLDSVRKNQWPACDGCWARRICHFCPALIICGHHDSLLVDGSVCERRRFSFDCTLRKILEKA